MDTLNGHVAVRVVADAGVLYFVARSVGTAMADARRMGYDDVKGAEIVVDNVPHDHAITTSEHYPRALAWAQRDDGKGRGAYLVCIQNGKPAARRPSFGEGARRALAFADGQFC